MGSAVKQRDLAKTWAQESRPRDPETKEQGKVQGWHPQETAGIKDSSSMPHFPRFFFLRQGHR